MGWQTATGAGWVAICVMLAFASPVDAADAPCGDAVVCGTSLDDSSIGDNQDGDAGADRDANDSEKN